LIRKRIKQNKNEIFYRILLPLIFVIFKTIFWPKVVGKENIPGKGRAVLAINHRNTLDPIIVMTSTWRPIHFLTKDKLYGKGFAWLFWLMSCIYVKRNSHDGASLQEAIECLKEDKLVGIFPEGTRNRTHDLILQDFKRGAVVMAQQTGAPIIPAAITGDFKPFSRNLMIRFGTPLTVPADQTVEEANAVLHDRIEKLWFENLKATNRTVEQEFASRKAYKKALEEEKEG